MMDDVIADPAGRELWGGNEKGLWKMVPMQTVVGGIVDGIEHRANQIIVPKTLTDCKSARIVPTPFRPDRLPRVKHPPGNRTRVQHRMA